MASNKKNQKPQDDNTGIEDGVIDGREQADGETSEGTEEPADERDWMSDDPAESPAADEVPVEPDTGEVTDAVRRYIAGLGNLHARIEKLSRAGSANGEQELAHSLNQLELLTGRLKMVLPAVISTTDGDLRRGLEALLSLL